MITRSKITSKIYDSDKVWYIVNFQQATAYIANGADTRLLDILYSTRSGKLIYVFPKDEFMQLLYEKWSKREIKWEGEIGVRTEIEGVGKEVHVDTDNERK